MALTLGNRLRKGPTKAELALSCNGEADLARQARIDKLRHLVASGRYEVQVERLALKILVRALNRK